MTHLGRLLAGAHRGGNVRVAAAARRELRKFSLDPTVTDNPWWRAPLGAVVSHLGFFTVVWPEVVHQLEGGLVKHTAKCLTSCLDFYGKGEDSQSKHNELS